MTCKREPNVFKLKNPWGLSQDAAACSRNRAHQHQLCRPTRSLRSTDGDRQRELGDGGAADRVQGGDEGRTPARHLRGVRRGGRGAAGP